MPWIPFYEKLYNNLEDVEVENKFLTKVDNFYTNEAGHTVKRPGNSLFLDIDYDYDLDSMFDWETNSKIVYTLNGRIYHSSYAPAAKTLVSGDTLGGGRTMITEAADGSALVMADSTGGKMVYWDGTNPADYIDSIGSYGSPPENVTHVITFDRSIIANEVGTGKVKWCDANDITAGWNALNFASADGATDQVKSLVKIGKEFGVIGTGTFEWFYNNLTTFATTGNMIDRGTAAPYSVVAIGQDVYMIDHERQWIIISGRQYKVLGYPKNNSFHDMSIISDCIAEFVPFRGKTWIMLSFKTEGKTFIYDYALDRWYDWSQYNAGNGLDEQFMAQCGVYIQSQNKMVLGSRSNDGLTYLMDHETYTDNENTIKCTLVSGHIDWNTDKVKTSSCVRFFFKRGVANAEEENPKVMIRWKDNRKDWGNWTQHDLGSFGEREPMIELRPMGQYQSRQYEIAFTDPNQFILLKVWEEVKILGST